MTVSLDHPSASRRRDPRRTWSVISCLPFPLTGGRSNVSTPFSSCRAGGGSLRASFAPSESVT